MNMLRLLSLLAVLPLPAVAADAMAPDAAPNRDRPGLEQRFAEMDTNRDGLVTASEIRAYLESKHGKGYARLALDKMQAAEQGASCGTVFAQRLY